MQTHEQLTRAGLTRTGFDVVERVGDAREALEELVGVDVLCLGADAVLLRQDVDVRVHRLHRLRRRTRLRFLQTQTADERCS